MVAVAEYRRVRTSAADADEGRGLVASGLRIWRRWRSVAVAGL